jgi:hypothetical protein
VTSVAIERSTSTRKAILVERSKTHRAHRLSEPNVRMRRLAHLHSKVVRRRVSSRNREVELALAFAKFESRVERPRPVKRVDTQTSVRAISVTTRDTAEAVAREAGA